MRNTIKRIVTIVLTLSIVVGLMVSFASCNKSSEKKVTLNSVYKSNASFGEFTSAERVTVLPAGWSVYTDSSSKNGESLTANSDIGYISSLDAFIIKTTDQTGDAVLSMIKLNDKTVYFEGGVEGMMFPISVGITSIRVRDNIIAVKYKNGDCAVYGDKANLLLSRTKVTGGKSVGIDSVIKLLGSNLVAVASTYSSQGVSGYTSIYRTTTKGELSDRGELVAYVKNPANDLSYVLGFDNKYVSVVGNDDSYMFKIPETASETVNKMDGSNGIVKAKDSTVQNYYSEITYIGKGRFYVYVDNTVTKEDDYTFTDGEDYYFVKRYIYNADKDEMSVYKDNANKIFLSLSNNYYDGSKNNITTNAYLNDGYSYSAYALNIFVKEDGTKMGFYDQYILDEDLNVVYSLTGNYGEELTMDKRDDITVLDLLMTSSDGIYYVPLFPSIVKYYDENGKLLGSNDDYEVLAQSYSNGLFVAQIVDPDDEDETLFGAFDKNGNVVVDFKYKSLTSFRGFYAIGIREDGDGKSIAVLVGKDGKEYNAMSDLSIPLSDMATTASNSYIYKIGCYMFTEKKDNVQFYGIKNLNPNVNKNILLPSTMTAGATLYSPSNSTDTVFVFEKVTATDSTVTYVIYKLA